MEHGGGTWQCGGVERGRGGAGTSTLTIRLTRCDDVLRPFLARPHHHYEYDDEGVA
jgi:hypothetical protein